MLRLRLKYRLRVQKWLPEEPGVAQHEGDQQSSQPPVAVEEGMDGLELDVREPGPDQHGKFVVRGVDEPLEVGHAFLDMVGRRRDEGRIAWPRAADPVLRPPELTWSHGLPTTVRKQPGVHLAHDAIRDREATAQPPDSVIQGCDGV